MENLLQTLTEWWNNNVAVANTAGITSMFIVLTYTYINTKLRKKQNAITIDVNQSSTEVNKLRNEVADLRKQEETLTERIALLTELLFVFANSTKINDTTKAQMAELYAKAKDGKVVEKVKETVVKVKEKVPEVIQEIKDVVETTKEAAQPVEDLYNKLKESVRA